MTESNFGQDRQARFGLADVGDAVRDYYDLLFDNVQEFIGMNHEEILEYGRENVELAAKLTAGGLEPSEETAIRKTMRGNTERVGEIRDFLSSDSAIPVGLDLSEDVLDNSEPELADSFHAAPVAEKYAYGHAPHTRSLRDVFPGRAVSPRGHGSRRPCVRGIPVFGIAGV